MSTPKPPGWIADRTPSEPVDRSEFATALDFVLFQVDQAFPDDHGPREWTEEVEAAATELAALRARVAELEGER